MVEFFRNFFHSLLHDEQKFRNWTHGVIGVIAASGAAYADQLVALGLPVHAAGYIRVGSVLCAFALAAHNAPDNPA